MPDILTRADSLESELAAIEQCIHSLLLPDSEVATATGKQITAEYGLAAIASLRMLLSENGSPDRENASERNLAQSSGLPEPPAAIETITISLPALRAVVLTLIDDGWQCSKGCDLRHPWAFPTEMFNGDRHPSDEDIGQREKFCDLLADRLRQLPARG